MLGLGNSLLGGVSSESFAPSDIAGLDVWFQVNKGVVGAAGGASNDGDMADGEDINSWADQSGNDRHASQTVASKKPHWETDAADFGGLKWSDDTADTHLNMATNVGGNSDNIEANEDFTVMIRVKLTAFNTVNGLIGSAAQEVIKWNNNKKSNNVNRMCLGRVLPVEGVFKDVLVWKGTALSDSQKIIYVYISIRTRLLN